VKIEHLISQSAILRVAVIIAYSGARINTQVNVNETQITSSSNDKHFDPHLAELANHFLVHPAVCDHAMDAADVAYQ
jgi:hypothetical protein